MGDRAFDRRRWRRFSIRSLLALIGLVAGGLAAYRYYERHYPQRTVV
jgi:hypothetical protein